MGMAKRHEARTAAVQLLFQNDYNPVALDEAFATFWAQRRADDEVRRFTEELVRGVLAHQAEIDPLSQQCADNWQLRRMAGVDRNIIRLAVYEMLHHADIPPAVSINEAVETAKSLSDCSSGRFVNGVLDRVRKVLNRSARGTSPDGATS